MLHAPYLSALPFGWSVLVWFPDWLESQSGERTPQELGISLWSHITQQFSMVVTKSWCLLENCTRWEATDVGFTHFPSLVAWQEAVLGQCAFATWWGQPLFCRICSVSSLVFATKHFHISCHQYFIIPPSGQPSFCRLCSVSSLVFATRSTFIFLATNTSSFPHHSKLKLPILYSCLTK